jgi:pimeloyl-ACP methyl ester carboxylesterase
MNSSNSARDHPRSRNSCGRRCANTARAIRRFARQIVPELDPSVGTDQRFIEWYARYLRRGASPGGALALTRMWNETDMRGVLPAIHVPTLILGRPDAAFPLQGPHADRFLAEQGQLAIFSAE